MMLKRADPRDRRGVTAVESAIVYPITMLLMIGTVVVGVGIFRYQQIQFLAREGARYASVHGPTYAEEQSQPEASAQSVQSYLQSFTVGMPGLECTNVIFSSSSTPCDVSVTLQYTWTPEGYYNPMTWTVTSTMPVTY